MNVDKIRKDFPILNKDNPVIYLDNACMTLRPMQVINSINEYYTDFPACALRSHHRLSKLATDKVNDSRKIIRKFIGAKDDKEILFTRNTTEGLNLVSNSLKLNYHDEVMTLDKEHNSNLIPWIHKSKKGLLKHKILYTDTENRFVLENFEETINKHVKLISFGHVSNLDGVKIPLKEIVKIAHDNGSKVMIDGAQSVPHMDINVKKLGVDFLAFSGHKMMGPSGIGALYVNEKNFEEMNTFLLGGETVYDSTYHSYKLEENPSRYEAGLQDYAGQIGLGAACKYLSRIGLNNIHKHELSLNKMISEELNDKVNLIGPSDFNLRGGIFNFNIKDMDPHIIAGLLDSSKNIAVRSGAHCVHSWFNAKGLNGSVRASLYAYNTKEEVSIFVDEIKRIIDLER